MKFGVEKLDGEEIMTLAFFVLTRTDRRTRCCAYYLR